MPKPTTIAAINVGRQGRTTTMAIKRLFIKRTDTKAIELNPKDAFVYYLRGTAWADKGRILDKAIEDCIQKQLELNPQDALALTHAFRGAAWFRKDEYGQSH